MNGYELSRQWFDFAKKNKRLVKPIHHTVIFWIFERQNQAEWEDEFQLSTSEACEILGISHKDTYQKAFKDLVSFGAVRLVQEAKGMYSARWISLINCPIYLPKKQVIQGVIDKVVGGVIPAPIIKPNKTNKTLLPPDVKNVGDTQPDILKNEGVVFNLSVDKKGITTCQTLREECKVYFRKNPTLYPDDMYSEFIKYWSEPNGKNVPRWYSEKTKKGGRWNLPSRLATWFKGYTSKKQTYAAPDKIRIPDRLKMEVV